MSKALTLVLLVVTMLVQLPTSANAWWCLGHMTIAEIAKQHLKIGTYNKLEALSQRLSSWGPFTWSPDFIQTACWPDDLDGYTNDLYSMSSWHYIDTPYNPEHLKIKSDVQEENVESVIKQLENTVKVQRDVGNQWIITFAMANLIHFIGDIHQPLHATDGYSRTFPDGDEGGNKVVIFVDGEKSELHAFWDSICWTNTGANAGPERPLTAKGFAMVEDLANYLMEEYGPKLSEREKTVIDSTIMADESYHAAATVAYPGITNGSTITQEYSKRCIPVAHRRLALGGYRLGYALEKYFGDDNIDTQVESAKTVLRHVAKGRTRINKVMQKTKPNHVSQQKQHDIAVQPPRPQASIHTSNKEHA